MKLVKKQIVHAPCNNYRDMVCVEDWKMLVNSLWDKVERGLALNHSTWKTRHTTWDNWIGSVR